MRVRFPPLAPCLSAGFVLSPQLIAAAANAGGSTRSIVRAQLDELVAPKLIHAFISCFFGLDHVPPVISILVDERI